MIQAGRVDPVRCSPPAYGKSRVQEWTAVLEAEWRAAEDGDSRIFCEVWLRESRAGFPALTGTIVRRLREEVPEY